MDELYNNLKASLINLKDKNDESIIKNFQKLPSEIVYTIFNVLYDKLGVTRVL